METTLSEYEQLAVSRLHALLELLPTALDKRLAPLGMTAFEHTVLSVLAANEQSRMRISSLARKTNASLPRISRVATSLEKRGLIARVQCSEDGRATNAVLTDAGKEALGRSRSVYSQAVKDLILAGLEKLPGDGVGQLADLSYAILTTLDPQAHELRAGECSADPPRKTDGDRSCPADPAVTIRE